MKKLLVIVLIATSSYAFAQPALRLNLYSMYAFDDKVDSYYSATDYFRGTIKGGFQWGGGLEYMAARDQGVELSYLRLDTNAPMEYYSRNTNKVEKADLNLVTNYILLGGNRYFGTSDKIEPYGALQAGMAIINVENPDNGISGNTTKFAWGAKLGLNFWANDKVGLKIQTGLVSAVQGAGGGFYFGTGGAGAGVTTYSTFYQFYIGGGLSFNMSKN